MKAAHFLLIPELLYSPPNNAIIRAYLQIGYSVDIYTPNKSKEHTYYGERVKLIEISYSWSWLIKHILDFKWSSYSLLSGTSEDPLAVIGLISFIYHKKSFALVDEIKVGSYRGDRSEIWKDLCKFCMRNSKFCIVNDESRISLLQGYAGLRNTENIIVFPGCYVERPELDLTVEEIKSSWGFSKNDFVIGSSGGFNLTAGADWLLNSLRDISDICAVIQPLGISELSLFLLESLQYQERLYIQKQRLDWHEAWVQASGFDVGLSIYTNPAPQFQKMGISSNRLCMFIAMGIPVIASRQKSFEFLERYECGIMVENYNEFKMAIKEIRNKNSFMKENCARCFSEYINMHERYRVLCSYIDQIGRS